ncbi:MAG: redox-sensing transcriptional repressor Rex, partial [Thermomicrobiaceae bacterium]|nr:redox-sensing transcriptional repressor Rex [Thermomicrobiaceae bacterium]
MRSEAIPDIVVRRLPIYVRTLRRMQAEGIASVSSEELGERIGVTAAQIRRDLSYFGKFGKQGKGYDVARLADEICHILHLDHQWDVALVGFGHLGQAIAHYRGFEPNGFRIAAIFARNPDHIGREVNGLVVLHEREITRVVREMGIKVGIVAVPAEAAQEVTDRLIAGGVRAILNYAPVILRVPEGVWIREIDPTSALQSLTFYLDGSDRVEA